MKSIVLSFALIVLSLTAFAKKSFNGSQPADTSKLLVEGKYAYYQRTVKADSIPEGLIYVRVVQFMASKNFQQNYGYMEEGKLIYTTTQDLNINPVYIGDDNDTVSPYTAQFSVTLDLKNGKYRYTISNVVLFFPTANGNKRETLYDVYVKTTNTESKRSARAYKMVVDSFERYIDTLTDELQESIVQNLKIYNNKF